MPAYKDEKKGTWYVSFHYFDWTGKNVRKLKRGFATKRKAQEWEQSFLRTKAASMDMTFSEFFTVYEKDVRPKLKENTWWSKEHIIRTKIIPYFGNTKMVDVTVRDACISPDKAIATYSIGLLSNNLCSFASDCSVVLRAASTSSHFIRNIFPSVNHTST